MLGYSASRVVGQKCYEVMAGLEDSGLTLDCAGGCACMRYARVGMVPAQMDVMMWCASGARKLLKVQPMVVVGSRRLRAAGGVPVRRCGGGIFNWSLSLGSRPRKFRWAVDGTGGRGAALLGTGLGKGWETRYIAEELGVSWYTARNHIENLRKKLGASSRLEAVMVAMRLGILPSE